MRRILITYDSGYGATRQVAGLVADALTGLGSEVDVRRVGSGELRGCDAAIVGSPIRLGRCTRRTKRFLQGNRAALAGMPVAFFFTCMSVTRTADGLAFPLWVDPGFSATSRAQRAMGFMERTHTASYYLRHLLGSIPGITPVGVAFFRGNLDLAGLRPIHRLVMRLAMLALPEIREGRFVSSDRVREWAESLSSRLEERR